MLAGNDAALAQSAELVDQVIETLKDCPTDTYYIIQQNGVSSADYLDRLTAPRASMANTNDKIRSSKIVAEVVGEFPVDVVSKRLQEQCGARLLKFDLTSEYVYVTPPTKLTL